MFENLASKIKYNGSDWETETLGIYVVVDSEGGGFWGSWNTVYEEDVEITWLNGAPVIWVFTT